MLGLRGVSNLLEMLYVHVLVGKSCLRPPFTLLGFLSDHLEMRKVEKYLLDSLECGDADVEVAGGRWIHQKMAQVTKVQM